MLRHRQLFVDRLHVLVWSLSLNDIMFFCATDGVPYTEVWQLPVFLHTGVDLNPDTVWQGKYEFLMMCL